MLHLIDSVRADDTISSRTLALLKVRNIVQRYLPGVPFQRVAQIVSEMQQAKPVDTSTFESTFESTFKRTFKRTLRAETKEAYRQRRTHDAPNQSELYDWMVPSEVAFFETCDPPTQRRMADAFVGMATSGAESVETGSRAPLRLRVLGSHLDASVKRQVLDRIKSVQGHEAPKYTEWLNSLLQLPLGTYARPDVDSNSPPAKVHRYLCQCRTIMDATVHGHDAFKEEMLSFVASWVRTDGAAAPGGAVGICGPVGVGKTTLVKHALAKAMNRPFYFISLGGASGAATLIGHNYTYEGSTPGEIATALSVTRCMNPVIFFDELDKVSSGDNGRGEEVMNALVHLTDPAQNATFRDRYFAGVDLDLSRALLVFSYNDAQRIPSVLRDRIHEVRVTDFSHTDKAAITRDFILPDLCRGLGLPRDAFHITEDAVGALVSDCAARNTGMREIRGVLAHILRAVNVVSLTGHNLMPLTMAMPGDASCPLPVTIDADLVQRVVVSRRSVCDCLHMYT